MQKTEDKNPEGSTTCELEKSKERSDEPDQRCQYNKEKPGADIQLLLALGNAMGKTAGEKQKLIDELNAAAQKLLQEQKDLCK